MTTDRRKKVVLEGSLVICPRCLTSNDKTLLLLQLKSHLKRHREKKTALLAHCVGCDWNLMLLPQPDGSLEILPISPYDDIEEDSGALTKVPPANEPSDEEAAWSGYRAGVESFQAEAYPEAYGHWRDALSWFSDRSPNAKITLALISNMGMALSRMGAPREALGYFKRALAPIKESQPPEAYATVLNNIGAAYLKIGKLGEAEKYHRRAFEVHDSRGSDQGLLHRERDNLAFTYAKIASCHVRADDLDEALRSIRKALALYRRREGGSQQRTCLVMAGNLLANLGDRERRLARAEGAVALFRESLEHFEAASADELLLESALKRLSSALREAGRLDEALDVMQRYDAIAERLAARPPALVSVSESAEDNREA